MNNKLVPLLINDDGVYATEQRDGSLQIVQEKNDVRDTQQIIHLSAEQWKALRNLRDFYARNGVIEAE